MALVVASVGSVAFLLLGIPLPLLLGPMAGCLIAALCRQPMEDIGVFSIFMRTFLGVAIGSSITPQVLNEFPRYLQSIFFIPIFVLIIGLVGYPLFRRVFHYDKATAYYASMPGGLSDMLIFGQEAGGNPRALSLIHATRVMGIIWVAPTLMAMVWQIDLRKPPGVPFHSVPVLELLLMPICGLLGWKIAERAFWRIHPWSNGPDSNRLIIRSYSYPATSRNPVVCTVFHWNFGRSSLLRDYPDRIAERYICWSRLQLDLGHYQRLFYHYDHQPRNRIRIKCSLGFSGRRTSRNDDDRGYYRSRFNLSTDALFDSLGIGGVGGTHRSPAFVMKKQSCAANAHLIDAEGRS